MNFSNILHIVIMILIPIIIFSTFARHKKNANREQKIEEETQKIKNALTDNNQYLKYKKKITIQTLINSISFILVCLYFIFLIFLPIFQTKIEVLDETLYKKNFSFIDNYEDVKNAYNKSANNYTDVSNITNIISVVVYSILTAWSIIMILKEIISAIIRDNEQNAEKIFCKIKADKKDYLDITTTICVFLAPIILPLLDALLAMNAEVQIESDSHYTITQIGNYLYYYYDNGELMCKVFLNNFKFCNGVSGYIAIPIILFICSSIFEIINIVMKRKLVAEIQNEKLNEPQTVETTNENDNIE